MYGLDFFFYSLLEILTEESAEYDSPVRQCTYAALTNITDLILSQCIRTKKLRFKGEPLKMAFTQRL